MTYNTTSRRKFSKQQRADFLTLHKSICYWCLLPITDDEWDVEHVLARELMPGKDADADGNLKPIHRKDCHKKKTALDRKLIAKSNRILRANGPVELRKKRKTIPSPANHKWPSRKFESRRKDV